MVTGDAGGAERIDAKPNIDVKSVLQQKGVIRPSRDPAKLPVSSTGRLSLHDTIG
jgi:hypothetical protein